MPRQRRVVICTRSGRQALLQVIIDPPKRQCRACRPRSPTIRRHSNSPGSSSRTLVRQGLCSANTRPLTITDRKRSVPVHDTKSSPMPTHLRRIRRAEQLAASSLGRRAVDAAECSPGPARHFAARLSRLVPAPKADARMPSARTADYLRPRRCAMYPRNLPRPAASSHQSALAPGSARPRGLAAKRRNPKYPRRAGRSLPGRHLRESPSSMNFRADSQRLAEGAYGIPCWQYTSVVGAGTGGPAAIARRTTGGRTLLLGTHGSRVGTWLYRQLLPRQPVGFSPKWTKRRGLWREIRGKLEPEHKANGRRALRQPAWISGSACSPGVSWTANASSASSSSPPRPRRCPARRVDSTARRHRRRRRPCRTRCTMSPSGTGSPARARPEIHQHRLHLRG